MPIAAEMSMNFALTPKHSVARARSESLSYRRKRSEQSRTPHRRAELVRQLRERSAFAPSFAANLGQIGQKKKNRMRPIDLAGESASHSCAVSQLLVGRRHRFGICVPETQSGPAVP